ncbi:aspartyl protease [Ceratobasidium sp. AG-Ba]|nr:aspartyl protease [Ceratobasidium sp. AG-Ba]QRW04408.1 aspartyl protease [Ceratobasidium sp. AG-Ba]
MLAPISLSVLLASILFNPAEAAPHPRNVGLVTLPLTRLHKARDDVHPQIFLQQHANRAHRRLARMTGKREPTEEEMSAAIQKRMVIVGNGIDALRNKKPQEKRKYTVGKVDSELARLRGGVDAKVNVAADAGNGVIVTTITTTITAASAAQTSSKSQSTVTAFVTVTAGAPAVSAPAEAANGTSTSSAATSTATAGAGAGNGTSTVGSNADGFSQVDLNAAIQGGVTKAGTPTANNSIGLDNEANDVGYLATIQLGTPPRDFSLLMDSGSADMWVGGEACKSQQGGGCGNHTFLGTQSSSSFKSLGKTFQVTYGTGQVAGDIITDDVVIAGLKLPTHTFGVATVESVEFSSNDVPFDGLVGLAQSTLSNQKTLTPPESLAKAGLIQSAITSYKISRLADGKNDGEITFGGIDETKIDPATVTTITNVNKNGFWEVPFSPSVNGKDLGLAGRTAILDTGTSLIIAPPADALALHQQIPGAKSDGQGGFTIPCTTAAQVSFKMGNQDFTIDPRDLLFVPVNQNDLKGDCVSGIMSGQIGGAQEWLVGDVFLKNAYFSHDVGKNAITLAKLV